MGEHQPRGVYWILYHTWLFRPIKLQHLWDITGRRPLSTYCKCLVFLMASSPLGAHTLHSIRISRATLTVQSTSLHSRLANICVSSNGSANKPATVLLKYCVSCAHAKGRHTSHGTMYSEPAHPQVIGKSSAFRCSISLLVSWHVSPSVLWM